MNINKIKTGRLIAERRKALNMTQSELAEKLHISAKAVSKWERAQNFPGVDMLKDLADVLGVHIEDLVDGEIVNTISNMHANNDLNALYLKNSKYINYLRIMDLNDIKEDLILICILNDYYYSHQNEMDDIYRRQYGFIRAYENLIKRNCEDIFLSLQNDMSTVKTIMNSGNFNKDSIEEANLTVSSIEFEMILLLDQKQYDVSKFDLNQQKIYDDILKYLIMRCEMRDYLSIFDINSCTRSYKRIIKDLNHKHYNLIEKYFKDDFVVKNGEYVFVEDFDKNDIINKFKTSIKIVEHEIRKALNNPEYVYDEVNSAYDEMIFYAAMLTQYDDLDK